MFPGYCKSFKLTRRDGGGGQTENICAVDVRKLQHKLQSAHRHTKQTDLQSFQQLRSNERRGERSR
ncbi:hypothetical protein ABVT39_003697 [Epinephelus coioides]